MGYREVDWAELRGAAKAYSVRYRRRLVLVAAIFALLAGALYGSLWGSESFRQRLARSQPDSAVEQPAVSLVPDPAASGAVGPSTIQTGGSTRLLPSVPGACTRSGYSRAKFGNHPSTADREAVRSIRKSPVDGSLLDPYTGKALAFADADLDHVVPLGWAWDHGACGWSTQLRVMFATDVHNLELVAAKLNRAKGDSGPADWLPPTGACAYWQRFVQLVHDYRLQLDPETDAAHAKACPA